MILFFCYINDLVNHRSIGGLVVDCRIAISINRDFIFVLVHQNTALWFGWNLRLDLVWCDILNAYL